MQPKFNKKRGVFNSRGPQAQKDRLAQLNGVVEAAKGCLDQDAFLKYKKSYEKYERDTIAILAEYPVNDPEYKIVCVKYLTELAVLRRLLKEVDGDINGK